MKIVIVSRHDPANVSAWSGTPYFITREIRKLSDDVSIVTAGQHDWRLLFARVCQGIFKPLGLSVDLSTTDLYSRSIGRKLQKEIEDIGPDVIVGIAASPELASIRTDVPVLHISDATYLVMTNYYPDVSRVPGWLWRQANDIEKRVIDMSRYAIFPSHWALSSARDDYAAAPEKLRLIRLGANVGALPAVDDAYLERKFSGRCNILFMGKEWGRKGGDIILAAFQKLQQQGMEVHLDIVGCDPFKGEPPDGVTVYRHIRKSDPAQFDLYNRLFSEASLFVLPTRAEAYGLVFAEAAAFATPVIAPATGGVPSVVEDGKTGLLLPPTAGGAEYAEAISALWQDKSALRQMASNSREKYSRELNWDRWRTDFEAVLHALLPVAPVEAAPPRLVGA